MFICIGKQKVVWIPKLRENGWEAAASALNAWCLLHIVDVLMMRFLILFIAHWKYVKAWFSWTLILVKGN